MGSRYIHVSFLLHLFMSDTVLRRGAVAQVLRAIHYAVYHPVHAQV